MAEFRPVILDGGVHKLLSVNDVLGLGHLHVQCSDTIAAPAALDTWKALNIEGTLTLAGGGVAPNALSLAYLAAPTITSAAAYTVPTAATLTIAGPPAVGGALTITAPLALNVLAGNAAFAARVGIGASPYAFVRADSRLEIHSVCQPVGNGAILLLEDTTLSASQTFPSDFGITLYGLDNTNTPQQIGSFSGGWTSGNNPASSETAVYVHANYYGGASIVSAVFYGHNGTAMFTPAGGISSAYAPGPNILAVYGLIASAPNAADIAAIATSQPGALCLANSTGNSRLDMGQDGTHYGNMAWVYNATPANAYMILNSNNNRLVLYSTTSVVVGSLVAPATASTQFQVLANKTIASAAGAVYDGVKLAASTASITGATGITTATGFNFTTIQAPTIAGDTATCVITNAATLYVSGPPVAGANVTITNPAALIVGSGKVGIGTNAPSAALHLKGAYAFDYVENTTNIGYGGIRILNDVGTSTRVLEIAYTGSSWGSAYWTGGPSGEQAAIGTGSGYPAPIVFGTYNTYRGQITGGGNWLIGQPTDAAATRLNVLASKSIASAAGAVWDGIKFATSTATITGATGITALSFTKIEAPTISGDTATCAITTAATLYVSGAPIAGTNVTIARPWAIRSDGSVQITAGNLVLGAAVTAGATADKCLALHNGATAPSASVDLCHLYCADNGAGHATLAIYAEEVVAAIGIKVPNEVFPILINGVVKYVMLAV